MIIHKENNHIRVIAGNITIQKNINNQGYALATGTDGVSYYLTKKNEDLVATPLGEVEVVMEAFYTH
jgi:hypothetical protein